MSLPQSSCCLTRLVLHGKLPVSLGVVPRLSCTSVSTTAALFLVPASGSGSIMAHSLGALTINVECSRRCASSTPLQHGASSECSRPCASSGILFVRMLAPVRVVGYSHKTLVRMLTPLRVVGYPLFVRRGLQHTARRVGGRSLSLSLLNGPQWLVDDDDARVSYVVTRHTPLLLDADSSTRRVGGRLFSPQVGGSHSFSSPVRRGLQHTASRRSVVL